VLFRSKSLLGELKVADLWNRRQLDRAFDDEQLCRMATSNPADALAWGHRLGRLRPELHGIKDADMGWKETVDSIRLARRDPAAARARSETEAHPEPPLELEPDKRGDLDKSVPLSEATEGDVDSLSHDAAYFRAVAAAGIHRRLLDGLDAYYRRRR
jgi:hypothetical protein